MDEIVHRISAWDGFSLVVREWRDGNARTPLLCLPGIVRTSGDFETFAQALGAGRRVVAPDYAGRGQSGRSRDIMRYAPEACLRDVLDICAALHLHQGNRDRHQLRRPAQHGSRGGASVAVPRGRAQ